MRGTVTKLWRYPVKSMLGEQCEYLDIDARGVVGDRLFAIRDSNGKFGSGKNTRRFRQIDGLFAFQATYDRQTPVLRFPDGRSIRADDPAIHNALSAILGQPVTLALETTISHLDAGPVHLLTTAALAWLRAVLPDAHADERRFRPNLVIDAPGKSQVERTWLGKMLTVGDKVTLRVQAATERCVMTTFAQTELPEDRRILRHLAQDAELQFGVYAEVVVPGRINRGDNVVVGQS